MYPGRLERVFCRQSWRGAEYDIHVENPDGVMKGVQELYLDGEKVERIPVMAQGSRHDVRVVMDSTGKERGH